MDAVKTLGSLLSNNAMGSKTGSNILDSLLGGGCGGRDQNAAGGILEALMGGGQRQGNNSGLGALGALLGAASQNQKSGGSGMDMLGDLLGGGGGQQSGGLGALAGMFGGGGDQSGGGGIGDLVGGLLGGSADKGAGGGGLSSLLGAATGGSGSDMLGALLGASPGPVNEPPKEAHDEAEILIEAMCKAARADGRVDESEKNAILAKLGDLDEDEIEFVKKHLSLPLDIDGFLAKVPNDMGQQVYAFSLMAVKLDSQAEAEYFARLASGLGLDGDTANRIHTQLGEPEIFA